MIPGLSTGQNVWPGFVHFNIYQVCLKQSYNDDGNHHRWGRSLTEALMTQEGQNVDKRLGEGHEAFYTTVFPLNMPEIFHNKKLNRQTLFSFIYQIADKILPNHQFK